VAGGSGTRLGASLPKAFVPLAGRPLLAHAVATSMRVRDVAALVIAVPHGYADRRHPIYRGWLPQAATLVPGGAERSDSVAAGLAALPDGDVVLVHDAARCLAPASMFERLIDAVRGGAAAVVPGIPVVDTIKAVDAEGWVVSTPERAGLRIAQTPQGFRRDILVRAHELGGSAATDDAVLVERLGERVLVIDGDPLAAKITTRDDLRAAERLLAGD
jgi:2-C-methyl-D-erythritol 4-phosphate cytidylyltransferase